MRPSFYTRQHAAGTLGVSSPIIPLFVVVISTRRESRSSGTNPGCLILWLTVRLRRLVSRSFGRPLLEAHRPILPVRLHECVGEQADERNGNAGAHADEK